MTEDGRWVTEDRCPAHSSLQLVCRLVKKNKTNPLGEYVDALLFMMVLVETHGRASLHEFHKFLL